LSGRRLRDNPNDQKLTYSLVILLGHECANSRLVLILTDVGDMSKQAVWPPFDKAHLGNHLGPHPMGPRQL
jgi:hypothetical protein